MRDIALSGWCWEVHPNSYDSLLSERQLSAGGCTTAPVCLTCLGEVGTSWLTSYVPKKYAALSNQQIDLRLKYPISRAATNSSRRSDQASRSISHKFRLI